VAPGWQSNTSPEAVAWRLEAAEEAIDLLLEVFTAWAGHPSPEVRSWAEKYASAVVSLVDRRRSGEDSA
jgi:hypothetical protein